MMIKKLSCFLAVVIASGFFTGCFSEWSGNGPAGAGSITISLGGPSGKAITPAEIAGMDFEITLKGPGGKINKTVKGNSTVAIQVIPGKWSVQVRGSGVTSGSAQPVLRTLGINQTIDVKAGTSTYASLEMFPAMEVRDSSDLSNDRVDAFENSGGGYMLITGNVAVESTVNLDKGVKIILFADRDVKISRSAGFGTPSFFNVDNGGTLVLGHAAMDGSITMDGSSNAPGYILALINVSNGILLMNDGISLINNGKGDSFDNGAVMLAPSSLLDEAHFIMNGGIIRDNVVPTGAVYVYPSPGTAYFTMNGGTITRNRNFLGDGGGVCIDSSGSAYFTMNGGTISYNEVEDGNGGGVYIGGFTSGIVSEFVMNGGTISHNQMKRTSTSTVGLGGGGVFVEGDFILAKFTMNGGTISGNTANTYGGGVCIKNAEFEMNGGNISRNTAHSSNNAHGGGVCLYGNNSTLTSFTMNNGNISGNTASTTTMAHTFGGGVAVFADLAGSIVDFTMDGGIISDNNAKDGGGVGIYANIGTGNFTMNSGAISKNIASLNGGGIYAHKSLAEVSAITLTGGVIKANTAVDYGGGVYLSYADFGKTGGIIYGMNGGENANRVSGGGVNPGHAVYKYLPTPPAYRNNTLGVSDPLDTAIPGINWND